MKTRITTLLLAFIAMLALPTAIKAEVTFKVQFNSSKGTELQYNRGPIFYEKGMAISATQYSGETTNEVKYTMDDSYAGKTLGYKCATGHEGTFKVEEGAVLPLDVKFLYFTTKDQDGNPVDYNNRTVSIYAAGKKVCDTSTSSDNPYLNEDEKQFFILNPADNYAYVATYYDKNTGKSYEQQGSIDVTSDTNLDIVFTLEAGNTDPDPVVVDRMLLIVPHYGELPVEFPNGSNYLYAYTYSENKDEIYNSRYYYLRYDSYYRYYYGNIPTGSYMIQDPNGSWSGEITVPNDGSTDAVYAYLDYYKVRFTSKNTDPNIWKSVTVGNTTLNTDGKGYVDFYLLPGIYTYSHGGTTNTFTVEDKDLAIDVTSYQINLTLKCDNMSAIQSQSLSLVGPDGSRTYLRADENGKINFMAQPGEYKIYYGSDYSNIVAATFTADANKDIEINFYKLKFTCNVEMNNTIYLRTSGESSSYVNLSYNNERYFPAGNYIYAYDWSGEWKDLTLDKDMVIERTMHQLTVKVLDTNNNPAEGIEVTLRKFDGNNYSNSYYGTTTANGECTILCDPGKYYAETSYDSKEVNVSGAQSVTLSCPPMVHFKVTENGKPFAIDHGHFYLYPASNPNQSIPVTFTAVGEAQARLYPTEKYSVSSMYSGIAYQGSTYVTEGSTIALGTISISSEGLGLAFPMDSWNGVSTYGIIVGSPIRLAAIPVGDKFVKWTINGQNYDEPMIDFKTTDDVTTATAVFGTNPNNIRAIQTNSTIEVDDNYVILPQSVNGKANIYTLDGKLVKTLGVVGDQVGIYDLPAGAYIMSLDSDQGIINARFMKK